MIVEGRGGFICNKYQTVDSLPIYEGNAQATRGSNYISYTLNPVLQYMGLQGIEQHLWGIDTQHAEVFGAVSTHQVAIIGLLDAI